jgi:molybdopterin-guanine dinucleotide biosynthesis protein A
LRFDSQVVLDYTVAMASTSATSTNPPVSVVILAGGQSRRLGRDKSLLELGGEPLVQRVVSQLAPLSDDPIIVANEPERYATLDLAVRFVADEVRGMGSLMGIYSGLSAALHAHALVVACDMPFLNVALLRYMISLAEEHDVVIPRLDQLLEPLHAIYSKTCLPSMARLLDRRERKIISFFEAVQVRYVEKDEIDRFDAEHLSFFNVNRPEDWQQVKRVHARHQFEQDRAT